MLQDLYGPAGLPFGFFVLSPLPSVGVLLAGTGGRCAQLLSGGGGLRKTGGSEQHWETQERKVVLVILV